MKVVIIFITSIMISIENVPCRCYTDVADMKFDRRPFLFSANVFVIFVVTIRGVHSQDFVRGDGIVPDDVQDNSCPYTDTVNDFSECTLDFWKVELSVIYFFIVMHFPIHFRLNVEMDTQRMISRVRNVILKKL